MWVGDRGVIVRDTQLGAPIAECAHLKSDDRPERVHRLRTAALEGEVGLTLSHFRGCRFRGAVVDQRTAHALDLPLEASRAAKRLILPRAKHGLWHCLGKRVAKRHWSYQVLVKARHASTRCCRLAYDIGKDRRRRRPYGLVANASKCWHARNPGSPARTKATPT